MATSVFQCARPESEHSAWTGGELNGRSILLVAEQGLGDVLQFIRFAPAVMSTRGPRGRGVPSAPDPAARRAARASTLWSIQTRLCRTATFTLT